MYSFYNSYYITVYTVYYPSNASESGKTTTIITVACVAIVVIVVIILLVVILIKFRSKNQTSEEQKSDNFEQNDIESTNTFSMPFSNSNVEEDPFAEDFKENKFIDQI